DPAPPLSAEEAVPAVHHHESHHAPAAGRAGLKMRLLTLLMSHMIEAVETTYALEETTDECDAKCARRRRAARPAGAAAAAACLGNRAGRQMQVRDHRQRPDAV